MISFYSCNVYSIYKVIQTLQQQLKNSQSGKYINVLGLLGLALNFSLSDQKITKSVRNSLQLEAIANLILLRIKNAQENN